MRVERIGSCELYLGDCREILPGLSVDHIITDPPFSARTHAGHDAGARGWRDGAARQTLGYGALSATDVADISGLFCGAASGWICWMTDHTLAPIIHSGLDGRGRYVFAPLPFYQPGRSVRLSGDGPSSWTDWIICARTAAQHRWGTLPGGYIASEGWGDKDRMGGKPILLMQALVRDYSRAGDLVLDPFMGGGTTLVACAQSGRRGVGIEIDPAVFDRACRRIESAARQPDMFIERPAAPVQGTLI
jgi:site-specific DNA-methyltransferase (adenine-specific)